MSSEIYEDDHMVSTKGLLPWHGLGTVLFEQYITAIKAVEAAKLGWEATKEIMYDADQVAIEDYRLLRRSDTRSVLSVVPKNWTPLQNVRLLEIAEALAQAPGVEDFQPVIETAGSLRNGKIVWALVQTSLRKFAGSEHKQYLLLSNGHYLGRGIRGTLTDTRVVCANTLGAAERSDAALFTNHQGDVESRVEEAINALGWATEATQATFAIYEALAAASCNVDQAVDLFYGLFPTQVENDTAGQSLISKNDALKVEEMAHLFRNGSGNEGSNAFDAFNAVTDWVDHSKEYSSKAGAFERRFQDVAMGGTGFAMKRQMFKAAQEFASV